MVRVMIRDQWKFPGGFYIFESNGSQVNPDSKEGASVLKILQRQKLERVEDNAQQIRMEKDHKKDINQDGFIGDPTKAENKIKKKDKHRWR